MAYYQRKQDVNEIAAGNGHGSFPLLGEKQGCTNGCIAPEGVPHQMKSADSGEPLTLFWFHAQP